MKTIIRIVLLLLPLFAASSCMYDEEEQELHFIGGTQTARWDVKAYFPEYITYNHGKKETGLDYLEEHKADFEGKNVVVFTGGSDIKEAIKMGLDKYAKKYFDVLQDMNTEVTYMISFIPANEEPEIYKAYNDSIHKLNTLIQEQIEERWKYTALYDIVFVDVEKVVADDNGDLNMNYSYDGFNLNEFGYNEVSQRLRKKLAD